MHILEARILSQVIFIWILMSRNYFHDFFLASNTVKVISGWIFVNGNPGLYLHCFRIFYVYLQV